MKVLHVVHDGTRNDLGPYMKARIESAAQWTGIGNACYRDVVFSTSPLCKWHTCLLKERQLITQNRGGHTPEGRAVNLTVHVPVVTQHDGDKSTEFAHDS